MRSLSPLRIELYSKLEYKSPNAPHPSARAMLARPPVNVGLPLPLLCATQKARSVAGFAWRRGFCRTPEGFPAAKLRRRVWFPPFPLSALRRLLARPPVNAGLLLPLLCAIQKARSVAGFAWREDFAAPLRGSPRQSFALPVSLLPFYCRPRGQCSRDLR